MTEQTQMALFVGDVAAHRRIVEQALERESFATAVATSVEEGLSCFASAPAQLIVLDSHIHGGSAADFLRRLQGQRPWPSVITLGEETSAEEAFQLAKLGARAFVATPFEPAAFHAALARATSRPEALKPAVSGAVGQLGLHEVEELVRETMVMEALTRTSGNRTAAARLLQVSRQHMQHMLRACHERVAGGAIALP